MAIDRRTALMALLGGGASLLGGCAAAPRPAAKTRRIGFIVGAGNAPLVDAFRTELGALGYVEGEQVIVELRLVQPNESPATQIAELMALDLELIVAGSLPHALAVRAANRQMPMVIATCPGMVSNGFAKSLARPGGIYTGIDELPQGVTQKRITLLKFAAPSISRVALLSTTPGTGGYETQLDDARKAAQALDLQVTPYRAASLTEIRNALDTMARDRMDALVNFQGGLSLANRQLIVDFVNEHRMPAMYQATLFVEAGGLMAWAPDLPNQYRMAARLLDKILKGASPGDLPVEHPPKYFLTINRATAASIGLTLPPRLMSQANRIVG